MRRRLMPGEAVEAEQQLTFKEKMVALHGDYVIADGWLFQDGTVMHRSGRIEEPMEQYSRLGNVIQYLTIKLEGVESAFEMFRSAVRCKIDGSEVKDEVERWVTKHRINPLDMSDEEIEDVLEQYASEIRKRRNRLTRLTEVLKRTPKSRDEEMRSHADLVQQCEEGEVIDHSAEPVVDEKSSRKLKALLRKHKV